MPHFVFYWPQQPASSGWVCNHKCGGYVFDLIIVFIFIIHLMQTGEKTITDLATLDDKVYQTLECVYLTHNDGEIKGIQLSNDKCMGGELKSYLFKDYVLIRDVRFQKELLEEVLERKIDIKIECKAINKRKGKMPKTSLPWKLGTSHGKKLEHCFHCTQLLKQRIDSQDSISNAHCQRYGGHMPQLPKSSQKVWYVLECSSASY